jgi:ribonucleoside-diphosphate reductase alpha chain
MEMEVQSSANANSFLHRITGKKKIEGLRFSPLFVPRGKYPYAMFEWDYRTACINDEKGRAIFEQPNVETPVFWSQTALNIVASKYFYGVLGAPDRETSIWHLISRVADTITQWGCEQKYFATSDDAEVFNKELGYILLNQIASFNSPVWFNVGVQESPQCSACFINSVDDNMGSILDLVRTEGLIFKSGSGTGTNFSSIRSRLEGLSGGGISSGPVSFMKGFDAFAGVIKSGGQTRRAAKMAILDVDHPDIIEFIRCKIKEERKAWDLIDLGYDGGIDGDAYSSIFFQNANNSVRVTDEFMEAVRDDKDWETIARTTGQPLEKYKARDILDEIAKSIWECGDPGLQFDTTINSWHTCAGEGRISSSNPCGEFMFLDNSACNLASLNLLKFLDHTGKFDAEMFKHVVDIMITAQDIVVDKSKYPNERIDKISRDFRPLGLGYANLGALLMTKGFPYDSDEGRDYATVITSLMTAEAYKQSAILAKQKGAFSGYVNNEESMLDVIDKHFNSWKDFVGNRHSKSREQYDVESSATSSWSDAAWLGHRGGFRNAQVSLLAPTGTIAFMMDCVTTGIEPELALIKQKNLVGGGVIRIVNQVVPEALANLGYLNSQITKIIGYIDENETIEGAPEFLRDDLPVFDCALSTLDGERFISSEGHLRMMAAVQPFLSGAISKTVNVQNDATPEDIKSIFLNAWDLGLKSVAVYREGSKRIQPLMTRNGKSHQVLKRRKLPKEKETIIHKFSISGHTGYVIVGMYSDGSPGEVFIRMAKSGSTVSGLMDSLAIATSLSLQYGVPLEVLAKRYIDNRFEPAGFTRNEDIPIAKSVVDYIFRWLSLKFLGKSVKSSKEDKSVLEQLRDKITDDTQICYNCGSLMFRSGVCYSCRNCGVTSGCG